MADLLEWHSHGEMRIKISRSCSTYLPKYLNRHCPLKISQNLCLYRSLIAGFIKRRKADVCQNISLSHQIHRRSHVRTTQITRGLNSTIISVITRTAYPPPSPVLSRCLTSCGRPDLYRGAVNNRPAGTGPSEAEAKRVLSRHANGRRLLLAAERNTAVSFDSHVTSGIQ